MICFQNYDFAYQIIMFWNWIYFCKVMIVTQLFRVSILKRVSVFNMLDELCICIPSVFTTPFSPSSKEELVVKLMAPLIYFEFSGPEMLEMDLVATTLFEKIGWKPFFWSFNGHNEEVTRQFALSFDRNTPQIGDL